MVTMSDLDYSISGISRISRGVQDHLGRGASSKTRKLRRTRRVGNAVLYTLDTDSSQARSISRLAFDMAKKRIRDSLDTDSGTTA